MRCQAAPSATEPTESGASVADRHQVLAAAWRGNWPRVAGVLPRAAETSQSRPLSPPAPSRSIPRLISKFMLLLRRPQHPQTQPPSSRSTAVTSRALCRTTTASISPIATPHLPLPPRLDCSSCHASVRAYSPFSFSPEFSVTMAASTASSPPFGSRALFLRFRVLAFG